MPATRLAGGASALSTLQRQDFSPVTVRLRNMTATSGIWADNTVKKDGHRWFGDARLFLAELLSILMLQTHGESGGVTGKKHMF